MCDRSLSQSRSNTKISQLCRSTTSDWVARTQVHFYTYLRTYVHAAMRMRMFLQTHYKGILAANTRAQADVNKCKYISLGK